MSTGIQSTNSRVKSSPAEDHRRQMRWQVWVPLYASVLIFVILAVLTIIGAFHESPQVERWGNLSAVWVIIPVLLSGIIFLALTGASVYGMSRLLKRVPDWMLRIQLLMVQLGLMVRRSADAATKPVMAVSGWNARIKSLWQQLSVRK